MQDLPYVALAAVALILGAAAFRIGRPLAPKAWRALGAASVAAVPIVWLSAFAVADRVLAMTAPVAAATFATYVAGVLLLVALLQAAAVLMPEPWVWTAAAVMPITAAVLAVLQPNTALGGIVAILFAASLLVMGVTLPRAVALASVDRSRVFVGLIAGLLLIVGGLYATIFAVAALSEGGLGITEAERALEVEVRPDFEGNYVLVVPAPVADVEGTIGEIAARWRGAARIVEGDGTLVSAPDGRSWEIRASGPVRIEARYAYHAPADARQNLTHYALAEVPLALDAPGHPNATASVTWRAVAALGDEPCATRAGSAVATAGAPAPFALDAARRLWAEPLCA